MHVHNDAIVTALYVKRGFYEYFSRLTRLIGVIDSRRDER